MRELTQEETLLKILKQIPWFTNITITSKLKDPGQRLWYALKTIENGWSRNVLTAQIEGRLIERQGHALTNFKETLSPEDSDLAQGILKDNYLLGFIAGDDSIKERELENQLSDHLIQFLMELGRGFAFVGRQYQIDVGGDEFYIDLLFYHLRLHCYIIIELKTGKFKPEYTGKMNFYLEAVDRQICTPQENPSIGLILCKEKNGLVVEYSLASSEKPMGVSTWKLTDQLPGNLKDALPTTKELQEGINHLEKDWRRQQGEPWFSPTKSRTNTFIFIDHRGSILQKRYQLDKNLQIRPFPCFPVPTRIRCSCCH